MGSEGSPHPRIIPPNETTVDTVKRPEPSGVSCVRVDWSGALDALFSAVALWQKCLHYVEFILFHLSCTVLA